MVGPVIFDSIKRYFTYSGYETKWVVNITDVDDKLIAEANKRGVPMDAVAEEMTEDYKSNLAAMGVDTVDDFPKATDYIDEIIEFTSDLIDKGFAYESEGDVYFDVAKFSEYGKLSNRTLDQMSGEGGGMADRKHSQFDFALWKSAKPGEPSWDSPWGKGRPGWHIECSVMSNSLLGETFDIHGGGLDLQFPHHENEIAQSEARNGKPMAKYWMHNGLMQASREVGKVGGRKTRDAEPEAKAGDLASQEAGKISKSKGSSAFSELLKKFQPENIRFFLLSSHYRRPIDYSEERLQEVGKGLEGFYRYFDRFEEVTGESFYALDAPKTRAEGDEFEKNTALEGEFGERVKEFRAKFLEVMDDDFNTAGVVAVLFDFARALNKFIESNKLETAPDAETADARQALVAATTIFREIASTLGLFREPIREESAQNDELLDRLMNVLIGLRSDAKKNKDFATADAIRNRLKEIGIALEDRPGGVCVWTKE